MGYVLPWGQISFWGATVITNLISSIPYLGQIMVEWIWGGFSVDLPTLNRFFTVHFLIPFLLILLIFVHLISLHKKGSRNPLGITLKTAKIRFYPYFTFKDLIMFILVFFFIIIIIFFFFSLEFFWSRQFYFSKFYSHSPSYSTWMVFFICLLNPS